MRRSKWLAVVAAVIITGVAIGTWTGTHTPPINSDAVGVRLDPFQMTKEKGPLPEAHYEDASFVFN